MKVPKALAEKFTKAMSTQEGQAFYNSWTEKSMGDFLRTVGGASDEQVNRIFMNGVTANLKPMESRGWQRNALTNLNYGSGSQNLITEEGLNFAQGAGMFTGAEDVYKNLARSKGFTIRSKKDAINVFNNRGQPTPSKSEQATKSLQNSLESNRNEYYKRKAEAQKNIQQDSFIRRLEGQRQYFENSRYSTSAEAAAQANIEEASQRGINKQLTGSQKEVGFSGNTAAAREEAELRNGNSPEAQKLQQIFREREAAEAAAQRNVEQARSIGEQQLQNYQDFRSQARGQQIYNKYQQEKANQAARENIATSMFANNRVATNIADNLGIEKNAAGAEEVKKIIQNAKNTPQEALGVGSGKPLQEGTLSYGYNPEKVSDTEKMYGISDLGFGSVDETNGMKIAARELSIDEAKLKSFIKQNDMPGTKAANDMLYGRVEKGLNSQYASIMKSDLSEEEKMAKWKTAREEAIERLRNGATFQDYFFGNRVHHGLAGMAAITGTLGVAFGGHKSNAELYSSPF